MQTLCFILSIFLALGSATGCSTAPATPEAAVVAAESFLSALTLKKAATAHSLMTEDARGAADRRTLTRYVKSHAISHEGTGTPIPLDVNWTQVPVRNFRLQWDEGAVLWPEYRLTLQHDGRRWRVAWAEPLMSQTRLAYDRSDYTGLLDLGRALTEIDPYHYRGYLEIHFALRGLKRLQEAEWGLTQSLDRATPVQLPDAHDALARFKLSLGEPDDALYYARKALEGAAPYVPRTYSERWVADTMAVEARALLAQGDRSAAEAVISRALELDPLNAPLAVLQWEMSTEP